ncbi:cytidylyltransferase domain-containing protein [Paenibacillus chungangensis]|uniref:N-acylneuraminate cytidylyltransferase n=1 Tax=Paenibacillus chungangensis TaxID=696535 RepID=A0ABW3HWP4_9BACL
MEKSLRTVAFIPVRGGSKGIPHKNIKPFCGKPLVYWTVAAAAKCEEIEKVFVSTDDSLIKKTVEEFGFPNVVVIDRSVESASDTATTESAMLEFANLFSFSHVVLLQATSPLIESQDIYQSLTQWKASKADSLVSVVRQKRFIWGESDHFALPLNYTPSQRPRRQDWNGYLVENGAIYITSRDLLLTTRCRISGNVAMYEMPEDTYFELDGITDWEVAEKLKLLRLKDALSLEEVIPEINLLISDVDGVLTDAGMYYSTSGDELKKFNTRDGKGIELLKNTGVKVMLLTAEDIEVVRARAEKLNVDYLFMGVKNKDTFLKQFFMDNPEYHYQKTAYIGDDVNDLESLKQVALSASPYDAHPTVRSFVQYICERRGGQGCVRELCDLIISYKE